MELNKTPSSPEKLSSDPAAAAAAAAAAATATDEQKSDPTPVTATDEQCWSPSQSHARTYECNFCKRGFSNAQALGGHMNIHRKDKAKLKQATVSITETPPPPPQQFREMSKAVLISHQPSNLFTPISTNAVLVPSHHDQETNRGAMASWNWNFSSPDITSTPTNQLGFVGEVRQLPLFRETTSKTEEQDLNSSSSSSSHGPDDDHELDLELRLGNEPSSDSSKGTRKFF